MLDLIYESMLIQEMTHEVVDYVEQHKDELPFDNIFKDKLRIAIPMQTEGEAGEILDSIKGIKDFYGFDFDTNEVIRKIKLNPKYGGGEKEQRVNLGKAINSLKIDPEKKKRYLNWFARYKDEMKDQLKDSEYAIILSRAPIDVVRMSDHRNISSCHSMGGSYFSCAVQEALTGGAVAYLVHKDVLNDYKELDDFQEADLFRDSDRGIYSGMEAPLARLRIRRITNDADDEAALPETSIYGNQKIPGFYNSVVSFLKTKQQLDPTDWEEMDINLHGGSYSDNYVNHLFQKYFDVEGFDVGNIREVDADKESDFRLNNIEDELQEIHQRWHRMEHVEFGYDVEDMEDQPYYMMWAHVSFSFEDEEFVIDEQDLIDIDDHYELGKMEDGDYDDEVEWSTFYDNLPSEIKDEFYISQMGWKGKTFWVSFSGNTEEDSTSTDPDNYDYFLRELDREIDRDYEEVHDKILEAMMASGIIADPTTDNDDYSRLKTLEDFEGWNYIEINGTNYRNFEVDIDFVFQSSVRGILDRDRDRQKENYNFLRELRSIFNIIPNYEVDKIFKNLLEDLYKPKIKSNDTQMEFEKFYESYQGGFDILKEFSVERVVYRTDYNEIRQNVYIKSQNWTNEFFDILDTIDENYKHFRNVMFLYTFRIFKKNMERSWSEDVKGWTPNNLSQLEHVYGKYLKEVSISPMI